jgi:antitoxin (DNA-binding transcriptional repressor) of toxin-antitoxin stability system
MSGKKEITAIPISKFKATCLAVLAQVKRSGHPVIVTRYGQALAQVAPPERVEHSQSWIGCMSRKAKIVGDVTLPASDESEWEALRP